MSTRRKTVTKIQVLAETRRRRVKTQMVGGTRRKRRNRMGSRTSPNR
jgi:hypothetical protein